MSCVNTELTYISVYKYVFTYFNIYIIIIYIPIEIDTRHLRYTNYARNVAQSIYIYMCIDRYIHIVSTYKLNLCNCFLYIHIYMQFSICCLTSDFAQA